MIFLSKEMPLIFIIVLLVVAISCADADKYVVIQLTSGGFELPRDLWGNDDIVCGHISYTNKKGILTYHKNQCLEAVIDGLQGAMKWSGDYFTNGVLTDDGGYARFICVPYIFTKNAGLSEDYLMVKTDKLILESNGRIAGKFIDSEISEYTILPLEQDQQEARELTDKLNARLSHGLRGLIDEKSPAQKQVGKLIYKTSFKCDMDGNNLYLVEKLICTDEELAKLDLQLNELYKKVLKAYNAKTEYLSKIKKWQVRWNNNKLDKRDVKVLINSYKERIAYFNCLLKDGSNYNSCEPLDK
ncbi:hypothetical protein RsTz2092_13610 [Deferribacterales bacterium RsTz2092]|nr:hypothetical protein AGMMS49941_11960 [Deferribacterales bacterium]